MDSSAQTPGTIFEYLGWKPPLPHQLAFCTATEPNVLLEGGRGSGKSIALRVLAHALALTFPNFSYLILRRTMPELRRTHLHHVERELKRVGGFFHRTNNTAHYPNGSTGTFAHCETDGDILNFLSSEYGLIGFDEASTFTKNQFLQISSSARAPEDAPYRAIVRAGTNPLGEGAAWVKQFFIAKSVNLAEHPDYHPDDFRAIHANLDQNPYIDREAYRKRLSTLGAFERRAWLDGEWIEADGYFADFLPSTRNAAEQAVPWHVIDELPTVKGRPLLSQPWISVFRAIDFGYHPNPAVCLWIAVLPNGRGIVFKERHWNKTSAADIAKDILADSRGLRVIDTFCDPSMFVASRATEGESVGDIVERNGIPLTPSMNDRIAAGHAIHEWLNTVIDEEPKLQILRDGCPNLIRTLPDMRQDKSNPERIADGEDDWVISLSYFCQSRISPSRDPDKPTTPAWMVPKKATRRPMGRVSNLT